MFELTLLGLVLSCFAAIGAKSLSKFSRHQLQELCQRRGALENLAKIKQNHASAALATSTVLYCCVVLTIVGAILSATQFQERHSTSLTNLEWATFLAALIFAFIFLVVWIPITFSRLWSVQVVYYFWSIWKIFSICLWPLEMIANFVDAIFFRLSGHRPDTSEEEQFSEEILTIVTEGHREGLLEDDAREMIEGVIELGDVVVSEIMTPRTDMCSMPITLTWDEMLSFVIKAPHSRIPVFDNNRDDIIGVIFAKDLLTELAKSHLEYRAPWATLLREPYFVPETKPVASLLQEFQKNHTHMVIVLDEYGGVSGVVTLEDILEEIVGEIVDEYDADIVDGITEISEASYHVLGKTHIDELNDRLSIGFPENDDYDTIAGFLLHRLGHVPVQGETLDYDGIRITIVSATLRRIEMVRIEPIPEETDII